MSEWNHTIKISIYCVNSASTDKIVREITNSSSSLQDLDALPTSQTCFFQIRLPEYTSREVLAEKLRYAIKHCRSIDMDNYMLRRGPDDFEEYDIDDW